jgi:type I restriction enzyme M protein
MLDHQRQRAIDAAVRAACDVFRGVVDEGDSRDFVLAMVLLKYLSDVEQVRPGLGDAQAAGVRFVVPEEASFKALHVARNLSGNGLRIDRALRTLEASNAALQGVLQGVHFDVMVLGDEGQRDRLLCQLLDVFAGLGALDFRGDADGAARVCDSLIQSTAASAGKRGGEFFTPPQISQLIARLVQPEAGDAIGDPCCGSGSLLIACNELARQRSEGNGCVLYGQEKNGSTWALARMNMILHGETQYQIAWGDTLRDPKLLAADGGLRKFQVVVSSPPFSLRDWGHETAEADVHNRYWRGVPPRMAGDYAFLTHMVETMHPKMGRMAAVVSLGVLFRGAGEQQIRKRLIEENLIDAVINLPAKMFPHTTIPVAVLVLRRDWHGQLFEAQRLPVFLGRQQRIRQLVLLLGIQLQSAEPQAVSAG